MNNDERVEEGETRVARPIASYIVRVWPSSDDALHGVAKHVQTGAEVPFASGSALVEILNSRTQTTESKEQNDETK